MSKIALGTVQFGLNYGISNTTGQVPAEEIQKILEFCKKMKLILWILLKVMVIVKKF